MRGVVMFMPVGSASLMRGLISSTATRSPSIDTSISSPRTVLPNNWPVGIECSCMRKTYSPSAGKVCITEMPPRVPNGAPSTCRICDAVRGTLIVVSAALARGSPTARLLMRLAARR